MLSGCPSICFDTHANILRKSVSCFSSSLPPHKKARLRVGDRHPGPPSAPQGPSSGQILCQASSQRGRPSDGLIEQSIAAEVTTALLPAIALGDISHGSAFLLSEPDGQDASHGNSLSRSPPHPHRVLGFSPLTRTHSGARDVGELGRTAEAVSFAAAQDSPTLPALPPSLVFS